MERGIRNADIDMQRVRGKGSWPSYHGSDDERVEFYSFFVAVRGAAKDPYLMPCLAKSEAQSSKAFFIKETSEDAVQIFQEATDLTFKRGPEGTLDCPVETYLAFGSQQDLFRDPNWKLGNCLRFTLSDGVVHLNQNLIRDLFASSVNSLTASGMKALRLQPVPADIMLLVRQLEPLIPRREPSSRANYDYIEKVLKHKPSDGRHRLSWLVLSPYLTNIKGMDENSAIETIMAYLGDSKYKQYVRSEVRRAARQGILPPSLSTLKSRHRDLYEIIEKEVLVAG